MRDDHEALIKALRSWAAGYREGPAALRFPADPHAEFFPQDLELAASELEKCLELIGTIRRECGTPWITDNQARKEIARLVDRFNGEEY